MPLGAIMTGHELKQYRKKNRLTQKDASRLLGVSQTYLSMLESDKRPLSDGLWAKAVKKFNLPLTDLPAKTRVYRVEKRSDDQLTADLAALGYAGFSHWKPSRQRNPADVLLSALNAGTRDARLVEALPWLVLEFPDIEWNSLVKTAKAYDLQNRLGFVTNLARRLAELNGDRPRADRLKKVEADLEHSKLEREDTLCKDTMTNAERKWLLAQRSKEAKNWHLVTDVVPQHLRYARK